MQQLADDMRALLDELQEAAEGLFVLASEEGLEEVEELMNEVLGRVEALRERYG